MKEDECFGKVAKCKHGKIGIIYGKGRIKEYVPTGKVNELIGKFHEFYIGVNLDGSKWQSENPEIIANNIRDFIKLAVVDANKIEENVKYYRGY